MLDLVCPVLKCHVLRRASFGLPFCFVVAILLIQHFFPPPSHMPSCPRSLVPIVQEFARNHGLEYKAAPLTTMLGEHYEYLQKNSKAPARNDPVDVLAFQP